MLKRACLSAALLVVVPAWPQVSSPINPAPNPGDNDQMATPPPVSGEAYPTEVGAEERANVLRGGVTYNTGYIDNFYAGSGGPPLSETTFSIRSTISLAQTSARQHLVFIYSPGYTFYRPTSELNETDQSAMMDYMFRPTPHTSLDFRDSFVDSSTSFSAASAPANGEISGSTPIVAPGVIAPFAQRLTNSAQGEFSLQYGVNGMIGGSGTLMKLHYPNPTEASGLFDSDEQGGSAFLNRRISGAQYTGITYQYARILEYPPDTQFETVTHTIDAFYSIDPKHGLSISVSGGPQHYEVTQSSVPGTGAWGPSVTASMGRQTAHTSVAVSYSYAVTGGGGLLGAYHSNSANASTRWQASRTWTIGAGGGYAINKSVTPSLLFAMPGGHSVSGTTMVDRALSNQLSLQFEYDRLHESYSGISAISNNPNSDREMVSLAWQFARPLGK